VQSYPRGGKALRGAFSRFQPRDTVAWYAQRGVKLKTEADGRMFPITDDSETIVDCLLQSARRAGVVVRVADPIASVTRSDQSANSKFELVLKSGERLSSDRLLLATGSNAQGHQIAKSLGHAIAPSVPSLFTFNIADPVLRSLAGVAVESARVKLLIPDQPLEKSLEKSLEQTGALLITHWGMSGPAILKLSAWGARVLHDCHYHAKLQVNWLPQETPESVRSALQQLKEAQPKKMIASHCPFTLSRRLWQYLSDRAEIPSETRWADLPKVRLNQLVQELTQGLYPIQGKSVFKEEFVTCGGVALNEVDFKTMQSRCCPGLFFAGEILDIDGVTGGFNFQSAEL
jgi:predicted Rossmann fold flavoprotein